MTSFADCVAWARRRFEDYLFCFFFITVKPRVENDKTATTNDKCAIINNDTSLIIVMTMMYSLMMIMIIVNYK